MSPILTSGTQTKSTNTDDSQHLISKHLLLLLEQYAKGLYLFQRPTGSGKTFLIAQLTATILQNPSHPFKRIFFITSQKKNIAGFKAEVIKHLGFPHPGILHIPSYVEGVFSKLLAISPDLPAAIKNSKEYKDLLKFDALLIHKNIQQRQQRLKEILNTPYAREDLSKKEVAFRKKIRFFLKNHSDNPKWDATKGKYKWIGEIYPSARLHEARLLLTTVKKFQYNIDEIHTKGASQMLHIYDAKKEQFLVLWDEIDQGKRELLDDIIQQDMDLSIELTTGLNNVISNLKDKPIDDLFKNLLQDSYKNKSVENIIAKYRKLINELIVIQSDLMLSSIFRWGDKPKSKNTIQGKETVFLFNTDTNIHLLPPHRKGTVYLDYINHSKYINYYQAQEERYEQGRSLKEYVNRLHAGYRIVYVIAQLFVNNTLRNKQVRRSNAIKNILVEVLGIDKKAGTWFKYFERALSKITAPKNIFDIDPLNFYSNGYSLSSLVEDADTKTTGLHNLRLSDTPENFLCQISQKALVIGVSATATIDSFISNFNLVYVNRDMP